MQLALERETWPINGVFRIARGARTEAAVLVCRLDADGLTGWGECVPYARYGESLDGVAEQIEAVRAAVEAAGPDADLPPSLPAGAARNALDCALWDLRAKRAGRPVHTLLDLLPPRPLETAVTISLGDAEDMADRARSLAARGLLKVKLGGPGDLDRLHAVRAAAPQARIIVDANEGWRADDLRTMLLECARLRIALIEQPLPADADEALASVPHPVPICADESAHTTADLERLLPLYDCVNIKLDKAGGLTEALAMREAAHRLGFSVMVGCMVGTSLAMAPAMLVAQEAEFVDLDGPLLLERDRPHGLAYSSALVSPADSRLWG